MSTVAKILESTDWNFTEASSSGIHSIHPYPAKFIPQIPRRLIQLFHPGDSSVVLDPFCGSGTTLVEAIDAGLDSWGIDLSPLASLIAKVKTTSLPLAVDGSMKRTIETAHKKFQAGSVQVPSIPRLDHWFKPEIQTALAALVQAIDEERELSIRDALRVALSSVIVRVSNQDSDTRYAAIQKDVSATDVFTLFGRAATTVSRAVYSFFSENLFRRMGRATTLCADIMAVTPKDIPARVGLVVTSPPYPNAYEYWLYHKYRMYWLGMDPVAVRKREIGARPHYFKTNHQDEHDYERQMGVCFHLLSQIMQAGAKACFLVGRSIIHGRVIDNVSILRRAAEPFGFVAEGVVRRSIPTTRKTFNPAHGKINEEHLVVFSFAAGGT